MKIGTLLITGTILSLALAPVAAVATTAVPKLSGGYVLTQTEICQEGFDVTTGSSYPPYVDVYVSVLNPIAPNGVGTVKEQLGIITFTPTSKTVAWAGAISFTGNKVSGSLVTMNYDSGAGLDGSAMALASKSSTGTYSNTATNVTLVVTGEATYNYTVVYSNIVSGVADRVDFIGVDSTNTCAIRGNLTHQ